MTTTGLLHLTIPIVTNVCSFFCFASDAKDFLAKSELLNYFEKIQTILLYYFFHCRFFQIHLRINSIYGQKKKTVCRLSTEYC